MEGLVVPTIIGSLVITLGLVGWLAYRQHRRERHVKRTNDKLNGRR